MRGDNPEQEQFRRLLLNVRNGEISQQDYQLLMTRFDAFQTAGEIQRFADSPKLVASHDAESQFNHQKLQELWTVMLHTKSNPQAFESSEEKPSTIAG